MEPHIQIQQEICVSRSAQYNDMRQQRSLELAARQEQPEEDSESVAAREGQYSQGELERKKSGLMINICIDTILAALILSMALSNKEEALQCQTPIFTWLIVFAILTLGCVLKNIALVAVLNSCRDPQLAESRLEVFFCCTLLNFEFAWLIYGNTFLYSSAGIACSELSDATRSLWLLMLVLLIYGYLLFLLMVFFVGAALYLLVTA